jgi:hypothetical protein
MVGEVRFPHVVIVDVDNAMAAAIGSQIGDRTHVVAPQRIVSRIDDAIIIAIVGSDL